MILNWKKFGQKGIDDTDLFEDMCLHLFVREIKATDKDVSAYKDQPGIETNPVQVNGKYYGFQSKYFSSGFKWSPIKKSLIKGIKKYPNLDCIYVYSNEDRSSGTTEDLIKKEGLKAGIEIKYITETSLKLLLGKKKNSDIRTAFFGDVSIEEYLKRALSKSEVSFFNSSKYIDLRLINGKGIKKEVKDVLYKGSKTKLLNGSPGSGKSILMQKMFAECAGIEKEYKLASSRNRVLRKGYLPVLIDAKECTNESLEVIISRLIGSEYGDSNFKMIYLIDGLDELSGKEADSILYQINKLSKAPNTHRVIVGCRISNLINSRAKSLLNLGSESIFEIDSLSFGDIEKYFTQRRTLSKRNMLKKQVSENSNFTRGITDVLLLQSLWENLEKLEGEASALRLVRFRVNTLLEHNSSRTDINDLNLLEPKREEIVSVLEGFSYDLYQDTRFVFTLRDLNNFILERFSRVNYTDTNSITDYLIGNFFSESPSYLNKYLTFQHRLYQDYFFVSKVVKEYELDRSVLRERQIIGNKDLFYELFFPLLAEKYTKEHNIAGMAEIATLKTYLGLDRKFGVQEPYHIYSSEVVPTLLSFNESLFELAVKDKGIGLLSQINVTLSDLVQISQSKHEWLAEKLFSEFQHNFTESLEQQDERKDNFYSRKIQEDFGSWLYLKNKFCGISLDATLAYVEGLVGKNEDHIIGVGSQSRLWSEDLYIKFFSFLATKSTDQVISCLSKLDQDKIMLFLDSSSTRIQFFGTEIITFLKEKLSRSDFSNSKVKHSLRLIYVKKILGYNLTKSDLGVVQEKFDYLHARRDIDFRGMNYLADYLLCGLILGGNDIFNPEKYPNVLVVEEKTFYAFLYQKYIEIHKDTSAGKEFIGEFVSYLHKEEVVPGRYFINQITELLVLIARDTLQHEDKRVFLKKTLIGYSVTTKFLLMSNISEHDPEEFRYLYSQEEVERIMNDYIAEKHDYGELVDANLIKSRMLAKIDPDSSFDLFTKALTQSVLRYGWSKDPLVIHYLPEVLNILYKRQYYSKERLLDFVLQSIEIANKAVRGTDNYMDHVANILRFLPYYDLGGAESIYKNYQEQVDYVDFSYLIIEKINLDYDYGEILDEIDSMRPRRNRRGDVIYDYPIAQFKCLVHFIDHDFYPDSIKKEKFEELYKLYEESKIGEASRDLSAEWRCEKEYVIFLKLCERYGKEKLVDNKKEGSYDVRKREVTSDEDFSEALKAIKTKKQMKDVYKKLHNYDFDIQISQPTTWKLLYKKTFQILEREEALRIVFDFLDHNSYLHSTWVNRNTNTLKHFFAEIVKDPSLKSELVDYVFKNGGHASFKVLIEVYDLVEDKEMVKALFMQFLGFSKLLVD